MNRTDNPTPTLSLDTQADETRMRRALGLQGGGPSTPHQQRPEQARQRHRFASDGSVPVVMLNRSDSESGGLKEKLAGLEAALESERAAHAATRRALHDQQLAHQALQTRLAHADIAHNEALAGERRARLAAEEALAAAQQAAAEPRRPAPKAEPKLPEPRLADPKLAEPKLASPPAERPARKPRPPAVARDPKPVRWWTPSYRAKKS